MLNAAALNSSEPIWQPDNYLGEASFRALLAGSPNVELVLGAALSGGSATKANTTVLSLPLLLNGTSPGVVSARLWIDACYEGDLLALAMQRSSWTFGREANTTYGEPLAGGGVGILDGGQNVGLPSASMSAYDQAGALLDFVAPFTSAPVPGAGDTLLQSAQYRVCLTQDPAIRVPFSAPPRYNATKYRALAAWATQGYVTPPTLGQLVGLGGGYGAAGNKRDPVAQYNTFGLDAPGLLVVVHGGGAGGGCFPTRRPCPPPQPAQPLWQPTGNTPRPGCSPWPMTLGSPPPPGPLCPLMGCVGMSGVGLTPPTGPPSYTFGR